MKLEKIKKEIAELPTGGLTTKKIVNKRNGEAYIYPVYQWNEEGKQKSIYLKEDEVNTYTVLINKRIRLEKKLEYLEKAQYFTKIIIDNELKDFISNVKEFKKREIIVHLENYLTNDDFNHVFILYGLRRTGKTTMIKQIINGMAQDDFYKTAFIQIIKGNEFSDLNHDLQLLQQQGYKYIFIDEITFLSDFIEGSAILADIYVSSGMKIVLSGTDSLGFALSKTNALYDRCHLLHTTFIPYHEFENVLNIKGIDEYIQYGGTMSISGKHYNIFDNKEDTDEYIDSSIAQNIQHSLKNYQDEGHFRHLFELYSHNELTNAINRVIEDINHRFTITVLTKDFKSNDLALSARNIRKENNILDCINKEQVTNILKERLSIKNLNEQKVGINEHHINEIKEYLVTLDLIKAIKIKSIESYKEIENRIVFIQPALRYSQAKALIESLMQEKLFSSLSINEINYLKERILNEIKGRMLEDIILLETMLNNTSKEVFKLQFLDGEYDMVIFDNTTVCCDIFEIKYSSTTNKDHYRHLINEEKNNITEFRYGKIKNKYVIYRGKNTIIDGVKYINVEEYLKNIGDFFNE